VKLELEVGDEIVFGSAEQLERLRDIANGQLFIVRDTHTSLLTILAWANI
jgi:hypothetical protein